MNVIDASAILAFVRDEPGAELVEDAFADAAVSAANWSEVAQKVLASGQDWDLVRVLLVSYNVAIEAVTVDDAEWAARRWKPGESLSLADRLCLALGSRLDATVFTADTSWGRTERIIQIR
jgi:ribonuclease VapC